jgi:hypothetical protein
MSSPRTARGKPPRTSLSSYRTAQKKGIATESGMPALSTQIRSAEKALAKVSADSRNRITSKGRERFKAGTGPHQGEAKGHQF